MFGGFFSGDTMFVCIPSEIVDIVLSDSDIPVEEMNKLISPSGMSIVSKENKFGIEADGLQSVTFATLRELYHYLRKQSLLFLLTSVSCQADMAIEQHDKHDRHNTKDRNTTSD